jgi:hypothetical protein
MKPVQTYHCLNRVQGRTSTTGGSAGYRPPVVNIP